MKKYLYLFLVFLLSLNVCSLKGQNVLLGLNVNTGLSKPADNMFWEYDLYTSNSLGLNMELKFNEKSSFVYGINLIQMTSWSNSENQELGVNQEEWVNIDNKNHLLYIGAPMYYKRSFGKIALRMGIQTLLPIITYSRLRSVGVVNGEAIENDIRYRNSVFHSIKIGPKVGVDYKLNDKFYLSADYYSTIFDSRTFSELDAVDQWLVFERQFMIGITKII